MSPIRVQANGKKYFAAFNEKKELIDSLEGPFADEKKVIKAIEKKYKTHIDSLKDELIVSTSSCNH